MLAVSAYGMSQLTQTPKSQRGSRAFLLAFSGVFATAGIARAFWPDPPAVVGATTEATLSEKFPTSSGLRMGETGGGGGAPALSSELRTFREQGGKSRTCIRRDSRGNSCSSGSTPKLVAGEVVDGEERAEELLIISGLNGDVHKTSRSAPRDLCVPPVYK